MKNHALAAPIPEEVLASIHTILDYLWEDERKDYDSRDADERTTHIFLELMLVSRWLAKQHTTTFA